MYRPPPQKLIEELRRIGYTVNVTHLRPAIPFDQPQNTRAEEWEHEREYKCKDELQNEKFKQRGGITVVHIKKLVGDVYKTVGYGEAICSHKDQFNRNMGLTIALGRALKDTEINVNALIQTIRTEERPSDKKVSQEHYYKDSSGYYVKGFNRYHYIYVPTEQKNDTKDLSGYYANIYKPDTINQ